MKTMYTVYVGGGEVNDRYLTKAEAEKLADAYREDGYDDVEIVEVDVDENKIMNNGEKPWDYSKHFN